MPNLKGDVGELERDRDQAKNYFPARKGYNVWGFSVRKKVNEGVCDRAAFLNLLPRTDSSCSPEHLEGIRLERAVVEEYKMVHNVEKMGARRRISSPLSQF